MQHLYLPRPSTCASDDKHQTAVRRGRRCFMHHPRIDTFSPTAAKRTGVIFQSSYFRGGRGLTVRGLDNAALPGCRRGHWEFNFKGPFWCAEAPVAPAFPRLAGSGNTNQNPNTRLSEHKAWLIYSNLGGGKRLQALHMSLLDW